MYRIIYKVCATEKEAKVKLRDVQNKVKNPRVVYSAKSNCWVVELYKCADRDEIESAYLYYKKQGISMNIQKC